jgi:hypothetical protein
METIHSLVVGSVASCLGLSSQIMVDLSLSRPQCKSWLMSISFLFVLLDPNNTPRYCRCNRGNHHSNNTKGGEEASPIPEQLMVYQSLD